MQLTIEEKITEFGCDKETADLMRSTVLNFAMNDVRIATPKPSNLSEQLELDFD